MSRKREGFGIAALAAWVLSSVGNYLLSHLPALTDAEAWRGIAITFGDARLEAGALTLNLLLADAFLVLAVVLLGPRAFFLVEKLWKQWSERRRWRSHVREVLPWLHGEE